MKTWTVEPPSVRQEMIGIQALTARAASLNIGGARLPVRRAFLRARRINLLFFLTGLKRRGTYAAPAGNFSASRWSIAVFRFVCAVDQRAR